MNARDGAALLKAARKVVSGGRYGECGQVAVKDGQLIVRAERDDNCMIARIDGIGEQGCLQEGQVFALDLADLGNWLKFAGPVLKNGIGSGELTITPLTESECAVRVYDKEWRLGGRTEGPPSQAEITPEVELEITADSLRSAFAEVSPCAAGKDDHRAVLHWLHFAQREGGLYVEAADGFLLVQRRICRMARIAGTASGELPGIDWQFGPMIEELLDLAKVEKVRVQVAGERARIAGQGFTIDSTAVGRFPYTEAIIQKDRIGAADALLVDVGEILRALPEAHMQTEYGELKGTGAVLLYTDDRATLKVKGPGQTLAEVKWGVHVNGKLLKKILQASHRDLLQVKWDYKMPASGALHLADDGDWIGLLMPMHIRDENRVGIPQQEGGD